MVLDLLNSVHCQPLSRYIQLFRILILLYISNIQSRPPIILLSNANTGGFLHSQGMAERWKKLAKQTGNHNACRGCEVKQKGFVKLLPLNPAELLFLLPNIMIDYLVTQKHQHSSVPRSNYLNLYILNKCSGLCLFHVFHSHLLNRRLYSNSYLPGGLDIDSNPC